MGERLALVHAWKDVRPLLGGQAMSSEDYEYRRRMENWRRWRISERRSLGGSPYPVYNLTPRPPRGENIMPLLAGEAEETDRAVQSLPTQLRRAVEVWYLREGSISQKRKMLGCRRERMLDLVGEARVRILRLLATRHLERTN
ncbi:MAG: hypothetical protein IT530_18390 [Burkholderiales bacterium]|nr:hypothetical protein [Burkholderiales bacterium]